MVRLPEKEDQRKEEEKESWNLETLIRRFFFIVRTEISLIKNSFSCAASVKISVDRLLALLAVLSAVAHAENAVTIRTA